MFFILLFWFQERSTNKYQSINHLQKSHDHLQNLVRNFEHPMTHIHFGKIVFYFTCLAYACWYVCQAREFAYDIVWLLLALVKLCSFFKFQEGFWVVSGKLSRNFDINKFENFFAWCLAWLTHVDMFVRLVNLLMTLLVSFLCLWNCVVFFFHFWKDFGSFRKDLGSFRKTFQKIRC